MDAIDITPVQRKTILALLKRHLPGVLVWAFGSRVKWTSRPESDLDLVAFASSSQKSQAAAAKEAFEESDVPFRVDLFVWDELPESFQKNIRKEHVVFVDKPEEQETPGGWRTVALGELTDNFDAVRVPVKEADRRFGTYPYYGASGVVDYVDGYLFDGEYLLIAEDGENLRTRKTPIAFMAQDKFWVNNHAHIVRGNQQADTRFLMYALRLADVGAFLSGSTMPKLTQANMNRIPIACPPLPTQHAIARILGSLDDLIDLNRRTNETLEQIARTLFTHYFPYSPDDDLPEGWRVVPLSEACEVNPSRLLRRGDVAPYLDMGNMPTNSPRAVEVYDREFNSGMRFLDGDTLVARITPCLENGKTCFVDFLGEGRIGWGSTEYSSCGPSRLCHQNTVTFSHVRMVSELSLSRAYSKSPCLAAKRRKKKFRKAALIA